MQYSDGTIPEAAYAPLQPQRRSVTWFRLAVGIGVLAWLVWTMDWSALRSVLPRVNVGLLAGSTLFYALLQVMSAFKWQLLLNAQGVRLPLGRLVRFYFIGMFFNLFLPTIVGGDAVRAYLTYQEKCSLEAATSSILIERATGFVAMLLIGLLGAATAPILTEQSARWLPPAAIVACAGLLFVLPAARAARRSRFSQFPFRRRLIRFYKALASYGQAPWVLLPVMGLSFVFQMGMVVIHMALLQACGYHVSLASMAFVVPALTLASLIPLSINGLGIREAASVYLLRLLHLPLQVGLLTSLLWRLVVMLASLAGLFLWLRRSTRDLVPHPARIPCSLEQV